MKKDESNNNSRGEAFNEMLRRAMKGSGQENAESSPVNGQTDDKPAFAEPIYRADETDEADEPLPPKGKKAKHGKEDEARDEAAERKEEKKRKKEDKKERARRAFRHFADEDEDFDISLRSLLGGDIFGSKRCDCGEQLHRAMQMIDQEGKGLVVYLNQEGRGIGLMNKIAAYKLQEEGDDTVDANIHLGFQPDEREYGVGAQILSELGVGKIRLITNNPVKRVGLESFGLEIVENVPIVVEPNPYNKRYLETKRIRMGHKL